MEKEFVPYEQALALKELWFDEGCLCAYDKNEMLYHGHKTDKLFTIFNSKLSIPCAAPIYQQAFKFFREKCKLKATVIPLWLSEDKFMVLIEGKRIIYR